MSANEGNQIILLTCKMPQKTNKHGEFGQNTFAYSLKIACVLRLKIRKQ